MKYTVIEDFTDLKDNRRVYRKGEEYPHSDAPEPSKRRVESLLSDKNKRDTPLIQEVKGEEDLQDLTKDVLKARLDEAGKDYKSNATKDELIEALTGE